MSKVLVIAGMSDPPLLSPTKLPHESFRNRMLPLTVERRSVGPPLPKEPKQELSSEDVAVEIANVLKLFKAKSDEAAAASQDSQTPQT